jgi:hypothetical protein
MYITVLYVNIMCTVNLLYSVHTFGDIFVLPETYSLHVILVAFEEIQMDLQRKLLNNKYTVWCMLYVLFVNSKVCHFTFCMLEVFHSQGMD